MEIIDEDTLDNVKNSILEFAEFLKKENNDNYSKLINNWNDINKLFLDSDNINDWPLSKNTFSIKFDLNKETINTHIRRLRLDGILKIGEDADYFIGGRGGPLTSTYITKRGAKKLLESMDSIEGTKYLYERYNIEKRIRPCFRYISILKYAVKDVDKPKREYSTINRYKIDLYLQTKKLAIECDERRHEHENINNIIDRQEVIENALGCRFIRFNPHPIKDFNIGEVIKHVYYYIFDKNINKKDPIDHYMKNYYRENRIIITQQDLEEFV